MIAIDDEMVELKTRCVPLLFECPVRRSSRDCPFAGIRESDVVARVNWLKAKPAMDLRTLLGHHGKCLERGEKQRE